MSFSALEKLPVIIPAYNEAAYIADTLRSLPADKVKPLVIANGCTDSTAQVAESFGVKVVREEVQGKMPALQRGLHLLGKAALGPVGLLDADARLVMPQAWAKGMAHNLTRHGSTTPEVVGAPVWFTEGNFAANAIRSMRRAQVAFMTRSETSSDAGQLGPNMGFHLKQPEVLEDILALPNIWPGQDRALCHVVMENGGRFRQTLSPGMLALSPTSVSFTSIADRLRFGREWARDRIQASYTERGAPGSVAFEDYLTQRPCTPSITVPTTE